jgi:uncharacterized membrane protein
MNNDQLSILSAQIEQIMSRLDRIEGAILLTPCASPPKAAPRQLERRIDEPAVETASPTTTPKTASPTTSSITTPITARPTTRTTTPPGPSREPSSQPFNLVGLVAVLCFVLAGVFFVKLSIDNGWLTPGRQIAGAALAGALFILGGYSLREGDQSYASLLPGAGVAILFVTIFGARFHYGMLDDRVAATLLVLVSLGCLKLYLDFKSDFYPLATALGTYIVPFILGEGPPQILSTGVFYIFWACLFSLLASTVANRNLLLMASYFGIGGFSLISLQLNDVVADTWALITIQSLQLLIFGAGHGLFTARHRIPMDDYHVMLLSPLIVWFYGSTFALLHDSSPGLAPWIMIALAAIILGLYRVVTVSSVKPTHSSALVEIFVGLTILHSVYVVLLPDAGGPLFATFLGAVYFTYLKRYVKIPLWGIIIVGVCFNEALSVLVGLFSGHSRANFIWIVYGIFISGTLITLGTLMPKQNGSAASNRALLFAGHAFGVATLFSLLGEQGSFAISLGWGLYALGVLSIGFKVKNQELAKSSLYILLFSVGKVLLFDLSFADTVVRIFCLLLTGSLLYVHGFLLRRISTL